MSMRSPIHVYDVNIFRCFSHPNNPLFIDAFLMIQIATVVFKDYMTYYALPSPVEDKTLLSAIGKKNIVLRSDPVCQI